MTGFGFKAVTGRSTWRGAILLILTALLLTPTAGRLASAQSKPDPKKDVGPKSPADPLVKEAEGLIEKQQWDQAIEKATQAIAKDENCQKAYIARGMAYNGKGRFDEAIADFDKVTSKGGRESWQVENRAEAYAHRSYALYQKGGFRPAIDSAYFAILERADHIPAHRNRAMAYLARNQFDKALNTANRIIKLDDKSALGYSLRGAAYAGKSNWGQAIKDQDQAIKLDSGLAIAYQRRAAAHYAKRDRAKAAEDLKRAFQYTKADSPDGLCNRASLYAMTGDMTKAVADLDEAIKRNPKFAKAHFDKGLVLLNQKDYAGALTAFDEAIKLNDDSAAAYCYRGYALQGKKDYDKAVEDFTKAISLDPRMIDAYSGRNEAYKKLGKTELASADMAKVRELKPPPPNKDKDKKKSKKKDDKRDEPPPPGFFVKSKPVEPNKRSLAQTAAQQIDKLVAANYVKHNIKPNEKTTDAQFVRRVYLDITGTIPTYQQTQKFLDTRNPDKRVELIDELLNSDGYASHFFNYWADVLRYTDHLNPSVRGEAYRQWLKQSLAENKPWDKMVYEMIAADGQIWDNPATGYLQRDANMPLDNMNNTVRIFLGTRIGCAQCHNHPFDRWTQKEFYQMAAFTFGTLTSTGGGDKRFWQSNPNDRLQEEYKDLDQEEEDRRRNSYRFNRLIRVNMMVVNDQPARKVSLPKDYQYEDAKPGQVIEPKTLFGKPAEVKPGEAPRKAFARWLTDRQNPRFALTIANRLWKQAFGLGQIEPVDNMMDDTVAENPELMRFLESQMKQLEFDMKEFLRAIYYSETYQREACADEVFPGQPYHFPGPILRRMTAEQVWDSFLTLAVIHPDEYHELPATMITDTIGLDLNKVTAAEVLDADNHCREIDGGRGKREQRYKYKGVLLARASELPSPVPPNHFLRTFGQSDRELISASSTAGSVPQVLFMFNGPITHMILEKDSTMYNNVMRKRTIEDGVTAVFRTVLSRSPDPDELKLAEDEVKQNGPAGYGNVVWSLVNTREFLFIQ